jgi:hypothetical protein
MQNDDLVHFAAKTVTVAERLMAQGLSPEWAHARRVLPVAVEVLGGGRRTSFRRSTRLARGTRGCALAPHEVFATHSHQLWPASSPVRFWTKLNGPRNPLPRLLPFHGSQFAQPDIAETHGAAVAAEGERTFADSVLVFRHDTVTGFTVDFLVQVD